MADNFKESKTKENLMRAFAGESQARNRYTIAADTARAAGMYPQSQRSFCIPQSRNVHMQHDFMNCSV